MKHVIQKMMHQPKSFEEYQQSDERRKLYENHPVFGKERLKERLADVNHADRENFKFFTEKNNQDVFHMKFKKGG